MSHIDKIPALRADIQKQALTTYNSVFRNPEQSRFVAADTGNKTIDGHRGTILFYDETESKFRVVMSDNSTDEGKQSTPLLLSPENISHLRKIDVCHYNSSPKIMKCSVSLANHFPLSDMVQPSIVFRYDVFCKVSKQFTVHELKTSDTHTRVSKLLQEMEQQEKEEQIRIEKEQRLIREGLANMHATRDPVTQRPRKKFKTGPEKAKPAVDAYWKAKIEHYLSLANPSIHSTTPDELANEDSEHLFTYPFQTVNNSLHECSDSLVALRPVSKILQLQDSIFYGKNTPRNIIINASSVTSMSPGCAFDSSVMDFCLSW
jgi:hypothetical protein